MQMRPYGSSGLRVPALGFGAMQVRGAFASHGARREGLA